MDLSKKESLKKISALTGIDIKTMGIVSISNSSHVINDRKNHKSMIIREDANGNLKILKKSK